jgi:hypothetical protein
MNNPLGKNGKSAKDEKSANKRWNISSLQLKNPFGKNEKLFGNKYNPLGKNEKSDSAKIYNPLGKNGKSDQ